MSSERSAVRRRRRALPLAVATLAVAAATTGAGLAATGARPVLRKLSITPTSLNAAGGKVTITVRASNATACVITSSPGIEGLPKAVSCKSGVASLPLRVPSNGYPLTRRFHISARAVHFQVSSPRSYRWLTQAATPRVLTCAGGLVVKPAYYVIFCADGNAWWQKVKWMDWGAKTAIGTGQYIENDCIPYCAKGHFRTHPATIVLSRLKTTRKYGPLYSQATVSYSVNGKHRAYTVPVPT